MSVAAAAAAGVWQVVVEVVLMMWACQCWVSLRPPLVRLRAPNWECVCVCVCVGWGEEDVTLTAVLSCVLCQQLPYTARVVSGDC